MYNHLILEANEEGIARASSLLKAGGIVAFPTETVYGLGANALDVDAVRSIFAAKGRPLTDPLIVHVVDKTQAIKLFDISSQEEEIFDLLATAFWPGPLTLIAKAASCIPSAVTAETGFVGIRCPAHPLAVKLLQACELPIAAPSANRFAHVSPTRAHHVLSDLGEKGVMVLTGDNDPQYSISTCEHGIESTVLRINPEERALQIFRQGAVTGADIERALAASPGLQWNWRVEIVSRIVKMHATPPPVPAAPALQDEPAPSVEGEEEVSREGQIAPGQAVTHYSPDVPCCVVSDLSISSMETGAVATAAVPLADAVHRTLTVGQVLSCSRGDLASCGIVVVDFGGRLSALQASAIGYRDLSPCGSSVEAARNLFDALRWAESVPGAGRVFIANVSGEGCDDGRLMLGLADRVFRAASGVTVSIQLRDV